MTKIKFLEALKIALSGLPEEDIKASVQYYNEMIDDKIEDGLTEEQAVAEIGEPQRVAEDILSEIPLSRLVKTKLKSKRSLNALEIVLLVLCSPIWLSLLVAAFAVIISLYASLWAVIIALWAVFASLAACFFSGIAAGVIFILKGNVASGIAVFGVGTVCAGLSILLFFGCKAATKGALSLAKKLAIWIKNCFIKKEEAQ